MVLFTDVTFPTAPPVVLTTRQRRVLERLERAAGTPQALASRVRIVLGAAAGESNRGLAHRLELVRNTVQKWRDRWVASQDVLRDAESAEAEAEAEDGSGARGAVGAHAHDVDRVVEALVRDVLSDDPRSGAPPTFTPEQLCQVVAIACESPPASDRPTSHWTPREIADEAVARGIVPRISVRTVGRFLVSGGGRAPAPPHALLAHPGTG